MGRLLCISTAPSAPSLVPQGRWTDLNARQLFQHQPLQDCSGFKVKTSPLSPGLQDRVFGVSLRLLQPLHSRWIPEITPESRPYTWSSQALLIQASSSQQSIVAIGRHTPSPLQGRCNSICPFMKVLTEFKSCSLKGTGRGQNPSTG